MPNYVTVELTAESPNFDFKKQFTSFNDVKPMPKILRTTTAGSVSYFVKKHKDKSLKEILSLRTCKTNTLKIARSYRAYQETGYCDWYDWSLEYWGVKWDMDIHYIEESCIKFDVPWCLPINAIKALSDKYPDIVFCCDFAEEQPGYFSGSTEFFNGAVNYQEIDLEFSKAAYERYFAICGGEDNYRSDEKAQTYQYIEDE